MIIIPENCDGPISPRECGGLLGVVDGDPAVYQSLSSLFEGEDCTIKRFASAFEFLEHAHLNGPCCLMVDPDLQGMDGFELQRSLAGSAVQFVFLTNHADVPTCARAMKAGAVDFLTKPAPPEALVEAACRGLARSKAIFTAKSARASAMAKIADLTSREKAVMLRVIGGMLNKQIAAELGIAEKTVKVHRGRVMRKTATVSVPDLVRLAITAGTTAPVRKTTAV